MCGQQRLASVSLRTLPGVQPGGQVSTPSHMSLFFKYQHFDLVANGAV